MALKIASVLKKSIQFISYGTTICCAAGAAFVGYHSTVYKAKLYAENKRLLDPKDGIYSAFLSELNGKSKAYIKKKFGKKSRDIGHPDQSMLEGGIFQYTYGGETLDINPVRFHFDGNVLTDVCILVLRYTEDDKTSLENLSARILNNKEFGVYKYDDRNEDGTGWIHQHITVKNSRDDKVNIAYTPKKTSIKPEEIVLSYYYVTDTRKLYDNVHADLIFWVKDYLRKTYIPSIKKLYEKKKSLKTTISDLFEKKKDHADEQMEEEPDLKDLDSRKQFQILNYYHNKEIFDPDGNSNPDYELSDDSIAAKYHEGEKIYQHVYAPVNAGIERDNFDYNVIIDDNIIGMITDDSDDLDDLIDTYPEHAIFVTVEGGEYKYFDSLQKQVLTGSDELHASLLVMYNKNKTSESETPENSGDIVY